MFRFPVRPVEVRALANDLLIVQSTVRIDSITMDEHSDRYDYFVTYRPDRKQAVILLRSESELLRVQVSTGLTDTGLRSRHDFVVSNPAATRNRALLR